MNNINAMQERYEHLFESEDLKTMRNLLFEHFRKKKFTNEEINEIYSYAIKAIRNVCIMSALDSEIMKTIAVIE